ncbi:MAG TPA: biotin/lipoyl-containing protein [Candidatus Polarisedimenticolia bacterium]|nr:biotin/lipoyl-containing protein [Candidatus Polarisedimenticolia bacterium]
MRYLARIGEKELAIEVVRRGGGRHTARLEGPPEGTRREIETRRGQGSILIDLAGRTVEAVVTRHRAPGAGNGPGGEIRCSVTIGGRTYPVRLLDPLRRGAGPAAPQRQGRAEVRSIMPGKITALLVREGQEVKRGEGLVVVEAMKMENELPAPKDGRVTSVRVKPGETVEAGMVLLSVE